MWVGWALGCAVSMGMVDILSKRGLREFDPWIVGTARLGFALPALAIPILRSGLPMLSPAFWATVAVMIPLEIAAFFFLLEALRVAPLVETVPFLSLSPLFTVLVSWCLLGERVTWLGFLGIGMIGAGGYLLYGHELRHGYLGPLKAMTRSRGTTLMVLVALLYSITSTLGKRAIELSSPMAFPGIYFALLAAVFVGIHLARGERPAAFLQAVARRPWLLVGLGLADGLTFLIHSIGVLLAPVAYFVGVKRLSSVVSVAVGGALFQERHLPLGVAGTTCMVAGVVLLTLGR